MGPNDESAGRYGGGFAVAAGCWPYGSESAGVGSICDVNDPDVVGSAPLSLRAGSFPFARGQRRGPGAQGAPRGHPDGSHGIVAAPIGPGGPRPITVSSCSDYSGCKDCSPGLSG